VIQSLGTFVFTFVAQHVVHLMYASLKPEIRTTSNWKFVSTLTMALSTTLSLGMAISVYVTFWEEASSNIFHLYPPSLALNTAKVLLSFMMMFTYPLPFLACRELVIVSIPTTVEGDTDKWWLLESKQLILPLHILVTVLLWSSSTVLALLAPSLGDVLNLVGCASGTMIAFILPAMFSFRLKGYTHLAGLIFVVGGTVGTAGTLFSLQTMLS
jgi:amino acid permease